MLFSAFVAGGYLLPETVHIERSMIINRPVTMMYELLNSYRYFKEWSPWVERDPQAVFVTSGPESGAGAHLSWVGEPQLVGTGWQEITSSTPYDRINIKLYLETQGLSDTGFRLIPQQGASKITWFFDSDLTQKDNHLDAFLARYFGLLFDRWIGGDYEKGLSKLKQYAESLPVSRFSLKDIEAVETVPQNILYVTTQSIRDAADFALAMSEAYREISVFMRVNGIRMAGQPMAITHALSNKGYRLDAAIPVDFFPKQLKGHIKSGVSPAGPAIRAVHHGGHEHMSSTYEKITAYISAHELSNTGVSWEHYISDPGDTAQQDMITHVYVMLDSADGSDQTSH